MQFENFNTAMTRLFNLEMVIMALRDLKPRTRKKLAEETGLSIATCGNLLTELLEQGRVFEIDDEEFSGGRPAKCYVYNPNHSLVAGLSVIYHTDKLTLNTIVSNLVGEIRQEASLDINPSEISQIETCVDELLAAHPEVKSLAIGVPGVVKDDEIISCDIEAMAGYPLKSRIVSRHKIQVTIENDMNLVALGISHKPDLETDSIIVAINFPKDSCGGAGIVIGGKILDGWTHFAGEISYLPLDVEHHEIIEMMNRPDEGLSSIIKTIISLIAIINPTQIALTGELVQPSMIPALLESCRKVIPEKNIPPISIIEDLQAEYNNGLIYLTLKSLSYSISQTSNLNDLVSKNIHRTARLR